MKRRGALLLALAAGCTTGSGVREGFIAPTPVVQVKWRLHLTEEPLVEYKPQEFATAEVGDGRIFIGSSAASFYALDPRDGTLLWKHKLGGAVASRPRYVAAEKAIFIGAQDGGLYALDAATGAERWVYRIKGPIESQPVYHEGLIYFTSGENRLYAVDAHSGSWRWQYDREGPESFTIRGYAGPLVLGNRVYVGFSDGYLACVGASSGEVLWARSLAGDATRFVDVDSTPVAYNNMLFVSSYAGGVYALDPKDGSTRWRFEVEGAGTIAANEDRLYFTAPRSGIHCLDLDGHLVWRQSLAKGGELSSPLVLGAHVLISSAELGTYVAEAATGRLEEFFAPGHGVTSEAVSDGNQVYLLSNGGYFYALSLAASARFAAGRLAPAL